MIAPPRPPQDDAELLIKEARHSPTAEEVTRRSRARDRRRARAQHLRLRGRRPPGERRAAAVGRAAMRQARLAAHRSFSQSFHFGGSTQAMMGGATLRNTSDSVCSLPTSRPTFRILWQGALLAIPVRPGTLAAPPWPRARTLAPDQRAFVVMDWLALPVIGGAAAARRFQRLCNRDTGANFKPLVELRYRDGLTLAARATGLTLPLCGPLHSSWMDVGRPQVER